MVAAAALLGEYLTAECWFGPTLASLFNVVPKDRRGEMSGTVGSVSAVDVDRSGDVVAANSVAIDTPSPSPGIVL